MDVPGWLLVLVGVAVGVWLPRAWDTLADAADTAVDWWWQLVDAVRLVIGVLALITVIALAGWGIAVGGM